VTIAVDDGYPLRDALEIANIPALLWVLVRLTGECRWLSAPYASKPPNGLSDKDSGRLSVEIQSEISDSDVRGIRRWREAACG
jgi:4-hydroxyacetophenone monooxygenase